MVDLGMIHGRFQPFTNGHMIYLKTVLEQSRELIIGITNPDKNHIKKTSFDSHRHLSSCNPYSFYERYQMIKQSVLDDPDICKRFNDISIVPFPIHHQDLWCAYLPDKGIVQFVNLLDDWDLEKKEMFSACGFTTVNLELPRITSATLVRELMSAHDKEWMNLVPGGTLKIIRESGCLYAE